MVEVSVETLTDDSGAVDPTAVRETIERLSDRAERDASAFEAPPEPDPDRALEYLRSGAGQAMATYIILRTGGRTYRFSETEFEALEVAMNQWFELYAASFGTDIDSDVSIRTAAETLLDTNDVREVAELLTGVPDARE